MGWGLLLSVFFSLLAAEKEDVEKVVGAELEKVDRFFENYRKEVKKITLKEALEIAAKNNPTIRTSALTRASSENTFFSNRYNYYFPTLGVVLSDNYTDSKTVLGVTDTNHSDQLSLNVRGRVPYIDLNYNFQPLALNHSDVQSTGESFSSTMGFVDLRLPIGKGFGPFNYALTIREFHLAILVARLNNDGVVVRILNAIRESYFDLLLATRALAIQKSTLKAAQDLVLQTQVKVKNSLLPEIEIDNALSNFYSAQSSVFKAQRDLAVSHQRFIQQIGLQETNDTPLWYEPQEEELLKEDEIPAWDVQALFKKAIETRQDYQTELKNLENSTIAETKAKNTRWPSVDLTASFTGVGVSGTTRGSALGDAWGKTGSNTMVGIQINWSLPFIIEWTAAKNASNDVRAKQINLDQLRDTLLTDITSTVNAIESNLLRVKSAKRATELTIRKLKAEETKFSLGEAAQKNVIDFQREVSVAKLSELEALVALKKSLIQLDNALGVTQTQ